MVRSSGIAMIGVVVWSLPRVDGIEKCLAR
jgi:hypothetical protein